MLREKGRAEKRRVSRIAQRERRGLPKKGRADKYLRQNGAASLGSLYLAVTCSHLFLSENPAKTTIYYAILHHSSAISQAKTRRRSAGFLVERWQTAGLRTGTGGCSRIAPRTPQMPLRDPRPSDGARAKAAPKTR
jgi:hypothetical protein